MSIDSAEAPDDQIEIQPVECEFYRGCSEPAQYEFEALVFTSGVQQVRACPGCTAEFLIPDVNRHVADVHRLDPAERWEASNGK